MSWIDYDGEQHNTKKIDWTSLQQNNYSFQIADYFDETDTELFDGGVGVFDFKVSLAVEKEAVIDDIIAAINNTYMSVTAGAYITSRFETATGAESRPNGVTTYASINYPATYASREYAHQAGGQGYDYGSESDLFIEAKPVTAKDGNLSSGPLITTVDAARTSNETWTFKFDMAGVGEVSATSVDVSYSSGERSEGTKDLWWYYYKDTSGNLVKLGKSISSKEYGNGTLGSVMACLTGGKNSATPGLLSSEGLSTCGGSIAIRFDLKATNAFQYGDGSSSTAVGSLTLNIAVMDGDDEESVLEKIKQALNDETILDLYKGPYTSEAYQIVWKSSAKTSLVERDVFRDELSYGNVSLNIHAGPSTKDKI